MKLAVRLFLAGLLVFSGTGCFPGEHKAQLTVRVTDDEGKPVADAMVAVLGFNRERKGRTDRDGRFTATLRNGMSGVDIVVDKRGYYSINRHVFDFVGGQTNGCWQPWNPEVNLALRKKGQPVSMVEKQVEEELPILEQPVGYDLLRSDWVAPYGRGKVSDFIFEAKRWSHGSNDVNGWLRLRFSNPKDGLIPVRLHWRNEYGLRLSAMAPDGDYKGKWWWPVGQREKPLDEGWLEEANMDQDANYYFRVRTNGEATGSRTSGLYGKIYRGISIGFWTYRTNVTVKFEYYLNPDGTRNIESEAERRRSGDLP
jgi:hypothetical protein